MFEGICVFIFQNIFITEELYTERDVLVKLDKCFYINTAHM